jgi:hypothetical protein
MVSLLASLTLGTSACGGGSSPPPTPSPGPSPPPGGNPPPASATITITAAGADPREVTIRVGRRVTFVNQDTVPHDMNSDPHPLHTDCPSLDAVAFLAAGQTKESAPFPVARTCGPDRLSKARTRRVIRFRGEKVAPGDGLQSRSASNESPWHVLCTMRPCSWSVESRELCGDCRRLRKGVHV